MSTSDELEAAGQRIAQRPVESIPLLAELERELGKRKQTTRLIGGMSVATAMLVGVGALTLLNAGGDQVQIVTASPVSEADRMLEQPAAGVDRRSAGPIEADELTIDVPDPEDEGTEQSAAADYEVSDAEADGDTPEAGTFDNGAVDDDREDIEHDGDSNDEDSNDDDDRDDDEDSDDEDSDDEDSEDEDGEDRDDEKNRGEDSSDAVLLRFFGDWRDGAVLTADSWVGDAAETEAAKAAANADETRTIDGSVVWIDRFERETERNGRSRSRDREWNQLVTVSTWADDGRFVQVTGEAKLEALLIGLLGSGGGLWLDSDERWERFKDREWLPLPPNVPRVEDWDEIEGWDDIEDWDN